MTACPFCGWKLVDRNGRCECDSCGHWVTWEVLRRPDRTIIVRTSGRIDPATGPPRIGPDHPTLSSARSIEDSVTVT